MTNYYEPYSWKLDFATCKRIQIPQSGKLVLLVESGILGSGITA